MEGNTGTICPSTSAPQSFYQCTELLNLWGQQAYQCMDLKIAFHKPICAFILYSWYALNVHVLVHALSALGWQFIALVTLQCLASHVLPTTCATCGLLVYNSLLQVKYSSAHITQQSPTGRQVSHTSSFQLVRPRDLLAVLPHNANTAELSY